MEMSPEIKELASALSNAQKEFEPIKKTALNPFFKSKYATLDAVLDAVVETLQAYGLSVSQLPEPDGLTTILMHKSGEWIKSKMNLCMDKQTAQAQGSAITYARRYALSAILNVASEPDDDGQEASKKTRKKPLTAEQKMKGAIEWIDKHFGNCTTPEEFEKAEKTLKSLDWCRPEYVDYLHKLENVAMGIEPDLNK